MFTGATLMLTVLVAAFLAYFVTGPGLTDGLGRQLTESPILMRFLFGQERLWAGAVWFAVDLIVFWGGLALGIYLLGVGEDK